MVMKIKVKSANALLTDIYAETAELGLKLSFEARKKYQEMCEIIGDRIYDVIDNTKKDRRTGITLYNIYDERSKRYITISSKDIADIVQKW